jgi:hypothetical protein
VALRNDLSQVLAIHRSKIVVQFINEGNPSRNVERDEFSIRQIVEVPDERADAVPVSDH